MPELKGTITHSMKNNDLQNPFGCIHMLPFLFLFCHNLAWQGTVYVTREIVIHMCVIVFENADVARLALHEFFKKNNLLISTYPTNHLVNFDCFIF
jgi:hypothetical protein